MRAHQVSSALSQSPGCAYRAQVSPGSVSPSCQPPFPLGRAPPVPDRSPQAWPAQCQPTAPWLFLCWDREGPLHPGFSGVTLFGKPPGANLVHLFRRSRGNPPHPQPPTGTPPPASPGQVPAGSTHCRALRDRKSSPGPGEQDRWAIEAARSPPQDGGVLRGRHR